MNKLEVLNEIFIKLGIDYTDNDYSGGRTVTETALIKILSKLIGNGNCKHGIFKLILEIKGIESESSDLSGGSTVTQTGLQKILDKL